MGSRFAAAITALFAGLALALPSPARTDDGEYELVTQLKAGRIRQQAALDRFDERIVELGKTCEVMQVERFKKEAQQFYDHFGSLGEARQVDIFEVSMAIDRFKMRCDSSAIRWGVRDWTGSCQLQEGRILIERLRALAENYQRQAQTARRIGQFGTVDAELATRYADQAKKDYDEALPLYNRLREECEKKAKEVKVGDASDAIPGADSGTVENVCHQPEGTGIPDSCNTYAALLGRWTSSRGGVIETYLESDGTLSGRIAAANPVMEANGYAPGMQVLRGWIPGPSSLTWLMAAREGEYFTAAQPDREPGEQYGTPAWIKSGVIFLELKDPNRLQIPATLENRLSRYEPWTRMGPPPAEADTDERTIASRTGYTLALGDGAGPVLAPALNDGKKVEPGDDGIELEDAGAPVSP